MMDQNFNKSPIFSIGITTYNRINLLNQMIQSLLHQDFSDYEILIGNDYQALPISREMLDVDDERIIIVNHEQNLGERENMNSLLKMAKGMYFTWQFDDDLCASDFLSMTYRTLREFNFPKCVFSSFCYIYGNANFSFPISRNSRSSLLSGSEFLRLYLSGRIRVLGLGGFHDTDYLRTLGGASRLTDGKMALYSEYLLIVNDGLLPDVAYINAKLVGNRVHDDSFSSKSSDVELFSHAGVRFIHESILILSQDSLKNHFEENVTSLLKSIISVVITKSTLRGISITRNELSEYFNQIRKEFKIIQSNELQKCAVKCLNKMENHIRLFRLKAILKNIIPLKYLKYAHIGASFISKFTNKAF
jgi:glycosyltransferase involved in cell wall biosynthesis